MIIVKGKDENNRYLSSWGFDYRIIDPNVTLYPDVNEEEYEY